MDALNPNVAMARVEAAILGLFIGEVSLEKELERQYRQRITSTLANL